MFADDQITVFIPVEHYHDSFLHQAIQSGRYFIDADNRRISSDYLPLLEVTARKHGVQRAAIRREVRDASLTDLHQRLFRNTIHRWLGQRLGIDARRGWRERYR